MTILNFNFIFKNAFDTFKVVETIPFDISGVLIEGHSKTIWQTLNHLIKWREFEIHQLSNSETLQAFNECESWTPELAPKNIDKWQLSI